MACWLRAQILSGSQGSDKAKVFIAELLHDMSDIFICLSVHEGIKGLGMSVLSFCGDNLMKVTTLEDQHEVILVVV